MKVNITIPISFDIVLPKRSILTFKDRNIANKKSVVKLFSLHLNACFLSVSLSIAEASRKHSPLKVASIANADNPIAIDCV